MTSFVIGIIKRSEHWPFMFEKISIKNISNICLFFLCNEVIWIKYQTKIFYYYSLVLNSLNIYDLISCIGLLHSIYISHEFLWPIIWFQHREEEKRKGGEKKTKRIYVIIYRACYINCPIFEQTKIFVSHNLVGAPKAWISNLIWVRTITNR